MTGDASSVDRLGRAGRFATWLGAAVLVTTIYGLGLEWLSERPSDGGGPDETLPAIMIELAEEPAAVNVDDNVASVSETDAQEVKSDEKQPLPDPVVEEKIEPKPAEHIAEPLPIEEKEPDLPQEAVKPVLSPEVTPEPEEEDPVVEEVTKILDNVAAPLPMRRPEQQEVSEKPPEKKIEKKKTRKKPVVHAQASDAAVTAKAKVAKAKDNAAKSASEGTATPASVSRWKSRVLTHIQRHARRQTAAGNATVRFRIDDRGNILSISIARSSGSAELDQAAIAMVRSSSPVPAPPEGVNKTILAPVRFKSR